MVDLERGGYFFWGGGYHNRYIYYAFSTYGAQHLPVPIIILHIFSVVPMCHDVRLGCRQTKGIMVHGWSHGFLGQRSCWLYKTSTTMRQTKHDSGTWKCLPGETHTCPHLKSSETLGACRQGVVSNHMGGAGREIL